MKSVAPRARFRQRVLKYALRYGVTKAADRYRVSRNTIYKWKARYNGDWRSLCERSHRPHSHPKAHSEAEKELIRRHYAKNRHDMMVLWWKLRKKGYTRSYGSLLRQVKKLGLKQETNKHQRYKPKPYQRAEYPGQKVQVDVKYVPSQRVVNGRKYYQYTAVDECSRWTYREMYDEHSTFSSTDFLNKLLKAAPFPIKRIQTDNGSEFTNALKAKNPEEQLSLFEQALKDYGIEYQRIRIATPRHNGKVERQHRIDGQRFYSKLRMYSLWDGRKQMAVYNKLSNEIPKICLGFKSPNEVLEQYLGVM
jgi:transposase